MRLHLRRTNAADVDLDDIWWHIAADNEPAATRLIERIEAAERRLLEYPELGPARPDLGAGVRSWVVGAYVLAYAVVDDTLLILRIVHGA